MERSELENEYPARWKLAEAYIPFQRYGPRYDPMEALARGTIFPALYRPYRKRKY